MLSFVSIIADGDSKDWNARPFPPDLDDWQHVAPGITPPDRTHWLYAGSINKLSKFVLANVPTELDVITFIRLFFDYKGKSFTLNPGLTAGLYLDDVLVDSTKNLNLSTNNVINQTMLEWTGLSISANVWRAATKRELWITSKDGSGYGGGSPPNFEAV